MRVGIIGIGSIAQVHISSLAEAGQNIVALCDIEIEKCCRANEKFNLNAKVYSSYIEMLEDQKLDAVHICTPHYLHAEMICAALKKDINVLCEKPIAISYEQLDMIKEAVSTSKAQLGVCQQNRFKASVKYVKEFFGDEEITSGFGTLCWQRGKDYSV